MSVVLLALELVCLTGGIESFVNVKSLFYFEEEITNFNEMQGVARETPELCSIANTCDIVVSPFITTSGFDK